MPESKSVLDNVEIKETDEFKKFAKRQPSGGSSSAPPRGKGKAEQLGIVGHCSTCGNPIYGPAKAEATPSSDPPVIVRRSCCCHQRSSTVQEIMQTK